MKEWLIDLYSIEEGPKRDRFIYESLKPKEMEHIFGKYFFPHIIRGNDETPDCHLDLIAELSSPEDSAVIFPRGFAKSTWEKIDTIHDIVYKLEDVILWVSVSLAAAEEHFESIKAEFESNGPLQRVYGNLVPADSANSKKWTSKHLETTNGVNLKARGANKGRGVNIKNRRPTKIVVDDAEEDEQVASPVRRRKFHNWLYGVIIPSKDKDRGKVKMVGTVIHPECEVLKFYKNFGGIFRKAIEDGKSIWPKGWPLEKLLRLRDGYTDEFGRRIAGIGSVLFEKEYQNNAVDQETAMFKSEWINENTYQEIPDVLAAFDIMMAVDPNAGKKENSDAMGICVVAKHRATNLRYVLEARKIHGLTISKRLDKMREIYNKWQPIRMGIEVVLNQTADYDLADETKEFRLMQIGPQGRSKIDRATRFQPIVEQGIVKFHILHTDLYEQTIQFPNGDHDDVFDACMYANEMLDGASSGRLRSKKNKSITGGIRSAVY